MINLNEFMDRVLTSARSAGISEAEICVASDKSLEVMSQKREIVRYSANSTLAVSLRGLYRGKMGYAASQATDDDAIDWMINAVKESAELVEDDTVQEIFSGSESYAILDQYNPKLDRVDENKVLDFCLDLEHRGLSIDPRISQSEGAIVEMSSGTKLLKNTYGLSLAFRDNMVGAYLGLIGRYQDKVSSESTMKFTRDFDRLDAEQIAHEVADKALFMLNADAVQSGTYHAVFSPEAMTSFLSTFSGVFSADNAQQGLSLLSHKEGTEIAASCVTLIDDPLYSGGASSCPFDAEGVATYTKNVIEKGILKTLLHNMKTANKAGVRTTGNASGGFGAPIGVSPWNFYIKPGESTLDSLLQNMQNGLVIEGVSGLHAGANPISGDFSLIARGYSVKNGKKAAPVNQITVAGNFYQLLKNIRAVANDLTFPSGSVGSPSVDVGQISVAGK